MTERKAFGCLIAYLTSGLAIVALVVFCIDPFYHYHRAWFGLPTIMEQAVYQTPGAARNFNYDSVVIGTSMTENFHASWFDEVFGWDTLKLSYSGARTDDLHAILGQVFEERSPANIVMDINDYQLTVPADTAYAVRPGYLYDDNILTDVSYLYNQDVLLMAMDRIVDKIKGRESNLDTAYTWEDEEFFDAAKVLAGEREVKEGLLASGPNSSAPDLETCESNLNNVIPYIEAHPETTFYVFYPPYSMLYWEQKVLQGNLEEMMEIYAYAAERLLAYDNVKLFYFQNEKEIISDLDNYRDSTHYKPMYNRYICESMKTEDRRLTKDNYKDAMQDMYEYALHFDYEALWAIEDK